MFEYRCSWCKKIFYSNTIRNGKKKYCSRECSSQGYIINLEGKVFGRLKVISLYSRGNKKPKWLCKCSCGKECIVLGYKLRSGHTKSCGCLHYDNTKKLNFKHGLSSHRLNAVWEMIKQRCYNPNNKDYKYYGGRGIKMCVEWFNDFMNFYNWAIKNGYKEGLSIERIDNSNGYNPNNCCWANRHQQANNTRFNRILKCREISNSIAEWARILDIPYKKLSWRLKMKDYNLEEAINVGIRKKEYTKEQIDKAFKKLEEIEPTRKNG